MLVEILTMSATLNVHSSMMISSERFSKLWPDITYVWNINDGQRLLEHKRAQNATSWWLDLWLEEEDDTTTIDYDDDDFFRLRGVGNDLSALVGAYDNSALLKTHKYIHWDCEAGKSLEMER